MEMNNRGHIPTVMLLVAAIFLVVTSLFSFYLFGNKVNESVRDLQLLEIEIGTSRFYVGEVFEDSVNMSSLNFSGDILEFMKKFEDIVSNRDLKLTSTLNFFAHVREGDYEVLDNKDGTYKIIIKNVFVKSEVENSEIVKTFDLEIEFDKKGIR